MSDVGAHTARNEEFARQWTLERRIRAAVGRDAPVIFDVGAHVGESHLAFRSMFPDAQIWSFEPDPASYDKLRAAVGEQDGGVCVPVALVDRDGTATFHRNPISHTNSLYGLNPQSMDSIDLVTGKRTRDATALAGEVIEVQTRRLDGFCQEHGITAVDLVKIDVQGAEVDVLTGAGDMLRNVGAVMVEISFFDVYEQSSSFYDVESRLRGTGLSLYCLGEISDNPMNGRTDWVTAIYTQGGTARAGRSRP